MVARISSRSDFLGRYAGFPELIFSCSGIYFKRPNLPGKCIRPAQNHQQITPHKKLIEKWAETQN